MEQNTQLIQTLRKAKKNTIIGGSIHHSIDTNVPVFTILATVIDQINDDSRNSVKQMPYVLDEGWEYISNWLKSYKLI